MWKILKFYKKHLIVRKNKWNFVYGKGEVFSFIFPKFQMILLKRN